MQQLEMCREQEEKEGEEGEEEPEVWWDMARPPTGLAGVSSWLWACRPPEKRLPTENV